MRDILRELLAHCEAIGQNFVGTTVDKAFEDGPHGQVQAVVCGVQKLGNAAARLPQAETGALRDEVYSLRKIGTLLAQADSHTALTFCKYDMQAFVDLCTKALQRC